MIVDITNELLTLIKTALPTVTVLTAYPTTAPAFPCVIFEDKANDTHTDTVDSSGENHNDLSFEINIFSNAQDRVSVVRGIRNTIDGIMSDTYRFNRTTSAPVPNYLDASVYRYVLRYTCVIDSNKQISRR